MKLVAILLGILCTAAPASEVLRRKIQVFLSYRDAHEQCEARVMGGQMFVSIEHDAGEPSRVVLHNYVWSEIYRWIYKAIEIPAGDVTLYRDPRGEYWIEKLRIAGAALPWVLIVPSERDSSCKFPRADARSLGRVSPGEFTTEFEFAGVDMGVPISYGTKTSFVGTDYSAALRFKQRQE